MPKRILVIKLSDIGDVLTATPALRALRQSFPAARIDALVPPNSAPVLLGSPLVDGILISRKFRYQKLLDALRPSVLAEALYVIIRLRSFRYDVAVILHHLTTRWGALKYAALALASGARTRLGLDNGRGWFLTHRARDLGFGAKHEVEYWLDVALIGAKTNDLSLEMAISAADEAYADEILPLATRPWLLATYSHPSRFEWIQPGKTVEPGGLRRGGRCPGRAVRGQDRPGGEGGRRNAAGGRLDEGGRPQFGGKDHIEATGRDSEEV